MARADGSYARLLARIARIDVLVIDDWALSSALEADRHDLLKGASRRKEKDQVTAAA